jgi:hypothetical protein
MSQIATYRCDTLNKNYETNINLNNSYRFSVYHPVNTLSFGYKNQSVNVAWSKTRGLFWDNTQYRNTLCGQNVEYFNVTLGDTESNNWALKI